GRRTKMLGAVMEKSNAAGPEAGLYEAFKVASLLASEFLTTQQVADVLAVTKWTLAYWRKRREGPPYVKLARGTIRYPKAAFEVYLKSQLQRRGLGKRQAATSLGEGSKMKSREKTSGKYSARSKRTEQA